MTTNKTERAEIPQEQQQQPTQQETRAVAKKQEAKPATLQTYIQGEDFFTRLAQLGVATPERFVRIALLAVNKTPKLMECDRNSVLQSMMDCASVGVEPDGRNAHLVPYGSKCQLILDYKGLIGLAMRDGHVTRWRAEIVCHNDDFQWQDGKITHRIDFRTDRGEPFAVYSIVTLADGTEDAEVMTVDECESIRKRSRAGNSGPWVSDPLAMYRKTCIRRHSKRLPLGESFARAIEHDGDRLEVSNANAQAEETAAAGILRKAKRAEVVEVTDANAHEDGGNA